MCVSWISGIHEQWARWACKIMLPRTGCFFCLFLIATWMTTAACSRMHHWLLLRTKPLDEETEEGVA